jgi:hypothetical protein
MATTTTAFEAELLAGGYTLNERGMMAGPAYKLRQQYLSGAVDPAAHTNSKNNAKGVAMMNNKNKTTSFDAITGP